jgi:hypothetical protein
MKLEEGRSSTTNAHESTRMRRGYVKFKLHLAGEAISPFPIRVDWCPFVVSVSQLRAHLRDLGLVRRQNPAAD